MRHIGGLVEGSVHVIGLGAHSNAQSIDFQAAIHGAGGCGCGLRLEGTYVLLSELHKDPRNQTTLHLDPLTLVCRARNRWFCVEKG